MIARYDNRTAGPALDAFERMLRGTPTQILQISRDASIVEACIAFAALSAIYHPRRFRDASPPLAHRAHRAYQHLIAALDLYVATVRGRLRRRISHPVGCRLPTFAEEPARETASARPSGASRSGPQRRREGTRAG